MKENDQKTTRIYIYIKVVEREKKSNETSHMSKYSCICYKKIIRR